MKRGQGAVGVRPSEGDAAGASCRGVVVYCDAAEAGAAAAATAGATPGAIAGTTGAADIPVAGAVIAAGAACDAALVLAEIGSRGTISSATMLMILISGLTAGPAVSL